MGIRSLAFVLLGMVLLAAGGCWKGNGERVPAVGIVLLDGEPLPDAYVTFRPDDGERGNGGFATTDAKGRFEIFYPDVGKGLIPATYRVTIASPPGGTSQGPPSGSPVPGGAGTRPSAQYPSVYSSPENTPLRIEVTGSAEPLMVELVSDSSKVRGRDIGGRRGSTR
jgi:hypothetical protein